jgi:hypothetical protein
MEIKRNIIVQAILTKDNELIPIWDERIEFEKTDMYGNILRLKGQYGNDHHHLTECIYDLKTKQLSIGIELDYYPDNNEIPYSVGETILHEAERFSHRTLSEAKISKIVFEDFEITINKGHKIDEYWKQRFPDVKFDKNNIYAIKQWKPYYLLDNGVKIKSEYQLYKFHRHDV